MRALKITHIVLIIMTLLLLFALCFLQGSAWRCYDKKQAIIESAVENESPADYQSYIEKAQIYEEKEAAVFPIFLIALLLTVIIQVVRIIFLMSTKRKT